MKTLLLCCCLYGYLHTCWIIWRGWRRYPEAPVMTPFRLGQAVLWLVLGVGVLY